MAELARYCEACSLPSMPLPDEDRPIVLAIIGKLKPLSRGALHLALKNIFALSARRSRAATNGQTGPRYWPAPRRTGYAIPRTRI